MGTPTSKGASVEATLPRKLWCPKSGHGSLESVGFTM